MERDKKALLFSKAEKNLRIDYAIFMPEKSGGLTFKTQIFRLRVHSRGYKLIIPSLLLLLLFFLQTLADTSQLHVITGDTNLAVAVSIRHLLRKKNTNNNWIKLPYRTQYRTQID